MQYYWDPDIIVYFYPNMPSTWGTDEEVTSTITGRHIAFSASFIIPVKAMVLMMMKLHRIFTLASWAERSIGGRICLLDPEMR
jgi:hypothetical protein